MKLWLVSHRDRGTSLRVVDADTAEAAVLARVEDPDDAIHAGDLVVVWRLGNFPEHYVAGAESLGNHSIASPAVS